VRKTYQWQPVPQRGADNQPAVNVTWIEAMAYCEWLSAALGFAVRLPTEWEWQQAATGGDPRNEFPWGEWQEGRANTFESELGRTTAVGLYPQGASAQGVLDLAGNTWEWCLNKFDTPSDVSAGGDARRVVRGGSWNDDRHARALRLPQRRRSRRPLRPSRLSGVVCLPHPEALSTAALISVNTVSLTLWNAAQRRSAGREAPRAKNFEGGTPQPRRSFRVSRTGQHRRGSASRQTTMRQRFCATIPAARHRQEPHPPFRKAGIDSNSWTSLRER
jgi:hypothetical protein